MRPQLFRAACFSTDQACFRDRWPPHTYFIDEETELAVISITTDDVNLYGGQGIYDNWWTDWKTLFLEYFNEDHEAVVGQYSGIKLEGGAGGSRSLPQKVSVSSRVVVPMAMGSSTTR